MARLFRLAPRQLAVLAAVLAAAAVVPPTQAYRTTYHYTDHACTMVPVVFEMSKDRCDASPCSPSGGTDLAALVECGQAGFDDAMPKGQGGYFIESIFSSSSCDRSTQLVVSGMKTERCIRITSARYLYATCSGSVTIEKTCRDEHCTDCVEETQSVNQCMKGEGGLYYTLNCSGASGARPLLLVVLGAAAVAAVLALVGL